MREAGWKCDMVCGEVEVEREQVQLERQRDCGVTLRSGSRVWYAGKTRALIPVSVVGSG